MWIRIMGRYETRYRRKLNMLEPGTRMLKLSAILAAAAGLCALFKWTLAARLLALAAGLIAGILLLLVAVELHQDKVLNEIAAQEADGARHPSRCGETAERSFKHSRRDENR